MVKRKFDIENYIDKSIAVHCKTMKELKIFLDYLSDIKHPFPGYNKEDPEHIICIMYSEYGSNLCVFIHNGWTSPTKRSFRFEYGSIRQHENYDILEFSDFDWFTKYDIEDGMLVTTYDGERYIKLSSYLVGQSSCISLSNYDYLLRNTSNRHKSIVAVYSSDILYTYKGISDDFFNYMMSLNCGYAQSYCLYERRQPITPKKLTIEQIEEKLGYPIEII